MLVYSAHVQLQNTENNENYISTKDYKQSCAGHSNKFLLWCLAINKRCKV